MKRLSSPLKFGGILSIFIIGLACRVLALPAISNDMYVAYLPWYDYLRTHGLQAIATNFSAYTPPYLYLLWLATLTSKFLPKIVAIKFISIIADTVGAIFVYRIVRLKYPGGLKSLLAGVLFWTLPTVMLNSSAWGQADALYTLFLLACLYYLLTDTPLLGVAAFGIAITIKAQAVFIAPLLAILFFKKRIPWRYFLIVPLVYLLLDLPASLLGRPLLAIFTIYSSQAAAFQELSMNAPNLYIFISNVPYGLGTMIGSAAALLIVGYWIWQNVRRQWIIHSQELVLASLVSVAIVPFLLPKMHDRYFYPADVFSLLAVFYLPELWFIPVLYQIISSLAYIVYLFNASVELTQVAAIVNTITLLFLVWKQSQTLHSSQTLSKEAQA